MVSFFLSRQPILTPDRPTDRGATGRRATGGGRREPAAAARPTFSLPSTKFPGSRARRRYERPAIPLGKRSKNKEGRGWSALRRQGFRAMGLNSIISPPPFLSRCSSGSSPLFLPQCFVEDPLPCPPHRNDVVKIRGFGEFPAFPDTVWVSRPSPCNRTRKRSLAFQMQKSEMERERIGETLY